MGRGRLSTLAALCLIGAGTLLSGCGDSPSGASPAPSIEVFGGTLQGSSRGFYPFSMAKPGTVRVSLTQAAGVLPGNMVYLGVGIGTLVENVAGACAIIAGPSDVAREETLSLPLAAGTYCLDVGLDVNNGLVHLPVPVAATNPVTYTVTVTHP